VSGSEPAWPVVAFDDGDFPSVFDGESDLIRWEEDEFWSEVSDDEDRWGRVVVAFDKNFRPSRILYTEGAAPVVETLDRAAEPELFKRKAVLALTIFHHRTWMWRRANRQQRAEFAAWSPEEIMSVLVKHVRDWDQL